VVDDELVEQSAEHRRRSGSVLCRGRGRAGAAFAGGGDAVAAFLPVTAPGAAAEYAAVPAEVLAAAPRAVELADAAALPSASLTAWQSLFEHADLQEGQSVLVNGAGARSAGTPSSWPSRPAPQ
jgi:D-arabinose 1-dehydrogenase-like Zn-dependent alcohol dehydrogenase